MGKTLIFDWMHRDVVVAHIECYADTGKVICKEYSDIPHWRFLGKRPPEIKYVMQKLEQRCPPRGRPDIKEILEFWGLQQYSVLDIVRHTHAHCSRDDLWMRFEGEDLKYADINVCRRMHPDFINQTAK